VHFLTDAYGTHWIDPRMAEAQKAESTRRCPARPHDHLRKLPVVQNSFWSTRHSDRQTDPLLLFDPAANKFMGYALARRGSTPSRWASAISSGFRARDGMKSRST